MSEGKPPQKSLTNSSGEIAPSDSVSDLEDTIVSVVNDETMYDVLVISVVNDHNDQEKSETRPFNTIDDVSPAVDSIDEDTKISKETGDGDHDQQKYPAAEYLTPAIHQVIPSKRQEENNRDNNMNGSTERNVSNSVRNDNTNHNLMYKDQVTEDRQIDQETRDGDHDEQKYPVTENLTHAIHQVTPSKTLEENNTDKKISGSAERNVSNTARNVVINQNDAIDVMYKDQVAVRSSRRRNNNAASGGVAEFVRDDYRKARIASPKRNYVTKVPRHVSAEPSLVSIPTEMAIVGSSATMAHSMSADEETKEEENETKTPSVPSQDTITSVHNSETNHSLHRPGVAYVEKSEDDFVVPEAYQVSSLIIEAQPVRRSYSLLIVVVLIMIIAGVMFGLLCRNGSCRLRSHQSSDDNVPSSSPTLQHQMISDSEELNHLVDLYLNDTFNGGDINVQRYGRIEYWDVSNITNFSSLFAKWRNNEVISFNSDLRWNVQNAVDMNNMFNGATAFNGNLSLWNVSSVTNFDSMFSETKAFQGIGLEHWSLSPLVTDLSYMFLGSALFDANLSRWDVSNVTSLVGTFASAEKFSGTGLEKWNTSQLMDVSYMFALASLFEGDLSRWDVSRVQWMDLMFQSATSFDSHLSSWNVSNVGTMASMFAGASAFQGRGLGNWNVSRVYDFSYMFQSASSFNEDLSGWITSNAYDMSSMFYDATVFQSNLSKWNVSNVQYMTSMFSGATMFDSDLSKWNVSNVQDMTSMFANANNFNGNLEGWDTSKVASMNAMFQYCGNFTGAGVSTWTTDSVSDVSYMFQGAVKFDGDLSRWTITNVYNIQGMFVGASSFAGVGLEGWDVGKVTSMDYVFQSADKFNGNLRWWDVSRVVSMRYTFSGASSYTGAFIGRWDISNITDMSGAFQGASRFDANLSKWDVSNVYTMEYLFSWASAFSGNGLSGWNVSNVMNFSHAFEGSGINADLSAWDVSSAGSMDYMFANAVNFDADLSSWNVENVQDFSYMFANASKFRGFGLENWKINDTAVVDHMFCGADSFDSSHISGWNTDSNVYC